MPLQIIALTPDFAVSPQLATTDFAFLAQQGFKTIINNRPDGEGGGAQPTSPEMERAATVPGGHYVYLPVVSGAIYPEQVRGLHKVVISAPSPGLGVWGAGAGSAQLFGLTQTLDAEAS